MILLGEATTVLAGGMESMSQAPYAFYGGRNGIPFGTAPELKDTLFAALMDPMAGLFMAQTAEKVAKTREISREAQDEYALRSHQLAAAAVADGRFGEEIAPVVIETRKGELVIDTDDHIKPETSIEALARLRAAFGKDGTVTAGNASGIVDGAAAVVMTTAERAEAEGLEVMSIIRGWSYVGVDPTEMGIGPVPAIRACLEKAGVAQGDVDLFEINEAFAAQVIACDRELGIDPEKLNVHGGSIALGHPIGATGCRIAVTLLHAMRQREARLGLATLCISGGMGLSVLFERV
jgi:acetyl-CoA acetyltransferase family protein